MNSKNAINWKPSPDLVQVETVALCFPIDKFLKDEEGEVPQIKYGTTGRGAVVGKLADGEVVTLWRDCALDRPSRQPEDVMVEWLLQANAMVEEKDMEVCFHGFRQVGPTMYARVGKRKPVPPKKGTKPQVPAPGEHNPRPLMEGDGWALWLVRAHHYNRDQPEEVLAELEVEGYPVLIPQTGSARTPFVFARDMACTDKGSTEFNRVAEFYQALTGYASIRAVQEVVGDSDEKSLSAERARLLSEIDNRNTANGAHPTVLNYYKTFAEFIWRDPAAPLRRATTGRVEDLRSDNFEIVRNVLNLLL